MATKAQVIQEWKSKIRERPNWAFRAALRIVEQQTPCEMNSSATLESNGVGLNSFDAPVVTGIISWHMQGKRLSRKQVATLQKIMPKYAGQLYRLVSK